jgi:hypothetical protein
VAQHEEDQDQLPEIHFGTATAKPTVNWRDEEFDDPDPDDDEELAETPADVISMLGFDPLDDEPDESSRSL